MTDFETISSADRQRLKDFVESGLKVMQEVEDLKGGLKDTVKALAEEFDTKPAVLNKVLKHAYKSSLDEEKDEVNIVENILHAVGRR